MIASDESQRTHTQPQGSGWYISAPSEEEGVRTVEVNGIKIEVGPKGIPENVVKTLIRWMYKEYEAGISSEKLAGKIALRHGGMMCKAPKLALNLDDDNEFPALGDGHSVKASDQCSVKQVNKYWFSLNKKQRKNKGQRTDGSRGLPPEYVQKFSDWTRGADNNINPTFLSDYTAADLGIPEEELGEFMASGLGPKEYLACSKTLNHLRSRLAMAWDRLKGDEFARETRDISIDASLIALFSSQVGLPNGFGERLWREFSKEMWGEIERDPEDVITDCINQGVLGENVGNAALGLLQRINPSLVWNYSGKNTPTTAERKAESAIQQFAKELLSQLKEKTADADDRDFTKLKYPDTEASSSETSDEETGREKEDCHNAMGEDEGLNAPDHHQDHPIIKADPPRLEDLFDGFLAESSDSCPSDSSPTDISTASSEVDDDVEPPILSDSQPSTDSAGNKPRRRAHHSKAKTCNDPKAERIKSKRQHGSQKRTRGGGNIIKEMKREKLQQQGERDGLIEHLQQQLAELRAEKDEQNKYCGFDPYEVLTFRNTQGTVIMRPTSDGISVNPAYSKGSHLFGWIAEVTSTDIEGTCFISVDKLMYMKNRYWSRATEVCKTSLLTSLVGEKWPYMSHYYLRPVDLERKAYDIIFDSSPDPDYSMGPVVSKSNYPKTESEILKRLRISDPNYFKDRRAYQLLPLDDTFMSYHFPICVDELEKMMCKRLTSKFNASNWKIPAMDSPWFKLYGDRSWDIEFDPQSNFGFFRDYAEKIIEVKTTLSKAEKKQWRDMADRIDMMGPREIVSKLKASLRAETNCFIKNELYAKDTTTLRLIISPSLFVKIVFGSVIKRIEEHLYSGNAELPITGHHIKHVPLSHAEALFCSWQSRGDGQFYETDYSAYESSQNETSLRTEFELYKSYYKPNSLADDILSTVLDQMLSGTVIVRNKHFSIRMPVMRWSGMPNTACGNLLMNYYNLVVNCGLNPESDFLLEGDDGIIWGDEALGRELETKSAFPLTMQMDYDYTRLSFCGLHYEGDAHVPADENLAIAKLLTYFDNQELSTQKKYELLYLRLISYQLLYPKWPALNSIIQQAEKFYHNSACKQISEATIRRWFNEQGWWMNQMLGDFDIADMVLPGGSYAFVHLCYENIDSIKKRPRPMVLARSEREMDRMLPEYKRGTGCRWLRKIGNVISTAGPAVGAALAISGRRKQALATVVASAAVSTIINEFAPSEGLEEQNKDKNPIGFLDRVWGAAGQVLPALFSVRSSDLSLDRSKISKPHASVIACKDGPASLLH